jgi:hypothetical protein
VDRACLCAAALFPLPGDFDTASDLIQVRKVVTRHHSQHHPQGGSAEREESDQALEIRARNGESLPLGECGIQSDLGQNGNIYTSAGISAGIDLGLAWVQEHCGSRISHKIARELVLFLRRPGGQTQLSASLSERASEMKAIHELQVWIAQKPS